jgi:hypothetical protein
MEIPKVVFKVKEIFSSEFYNIAFAVWQYEWL